MKIKTIILTIFCVLFFSCNGKDELNIAARQVLGEIKTKIKDIKEARQIIANSEKTYEYFPQDKEKWDAAYEKFKTILK